jgi:hypothetical protein
LDRIEDIPKSKKKSKKKKPQYGFEDPGEEIETKAPEIVVEPATPAVTEERKGRRRRAKNEDSSVVKFACKKCSESFTSKSALFRHLDATGHHALVSQLR